MFDLAWSEILLVAIVALIVIGPKDLPGAIRGIAETVKKARKGLASMQQQADELVREAKLDDVRNQIAEVKGAISDIRRFDLRGEVERTVDADGTLQSSFNDPPLGAGMAATPVWTPPPTARETPDAPAMIPPQTMAPYKPPPEPAKPQVPDFVPPATPAPAATVQPIATPSAAVMPPALAAEPVRLPETRPA